MYTQMLVFYARSLMSQIAAKRARGQGLSEYLGLLIGLAVIIVAVVIIIGARLKAKAENATW
jgi:ABC-type nickel/cobalt efflux system permease component RcnA